MNVAFFDFDGTLVKGDSLFAFLKFYYRNNKFFFYFKAIKCLPLLISFKLGIIDNNTAKEKLFITFFKGENKNNFLKIAQEFSNLWIPKNLKVDAIKKLKWHQEQGDKIYIVSASIEAYLEPFAIAHSLSLIATKLESTKPILSGKFSSPNCYGKEKVNRIQKEVKLTDYKESYAYGDSNGDRELLAMVKHAYYRRFS